MSSNRTLLNMSSYSAAQDSFGHEASQPDSASRHQEFPTICPLHSIYLTGDAAEHAAQSGAFLICPCSQSTSAADTNVRDYKHKKETDEITSEPAVVRPQISTFDETDDGYDGEDEALNERQLKRRRVSLQVKPEAATYIACGVTTDTEDAHLADDEYDSSTADEAADGPYPKQYKIPLFTDLDAVIASETPSDTEDESFLGSDEDTTDSDDNGLTTDNDTVSTSSMTSLSSPSTQPASPPIVRARPVVGSESLLYDSDLQGFIERASLTSVALAPFLDELQHPGSRLPPKPRFRRRRQPTPAPFTIYEDNIDTPSGQPEARLPAEGREDVRVPAVNHRALIPLDRGQENRQPTVRQGEAPIDFAEFLDEDDGEEEEMVPVRPIIEQRSWWPF